MPSVLLTRHGLSQHNLETRFYMGRASASRLVAEGRAQASALGAHLARSPFPGPGGGTGLDRIIASSLPRTMETALRIVAELRGAGDRNVTLHEDDAFWELSKGEWEGTMPRDGVPEPERTLLATQPFQFRYPGGESFADVVARVAPAFERWIRAHARERLLFVLHGDVLCALLYHLLGLPPAEVPKYLVAPCSLTELVREPDGWRMARLGDNGFLE